MSRTHQRWLAERLPEWERDGIVTAAGARRLRERYPDQPPGVLAQTIVGAVGALLIGTGLIAVLAYNWDEFPRWIRLGFALGPLAASQAVSGWVLGRGAAARPWMRESTAVAQTLAVGAALALVSQIYNVPGAWSDLVFWWCIVAVPLSWVLHSDAVAIAYLIGLAVWTVAQAEAHGNWLSVAHVADVRIWFPLLLGGILPRWPGPQLHDRPQMVSRFVLAGSVLVGLLAVAAYTGIRPHEQSSAFFWLAMLSGVVVLLFPLDRSGIEEPLSCKPQVLLGGLTLLGMALAATYEVPAHELVQSVGVGLPLGWCWLLLVVAAGFAIRACQQGRFAELSIAAVAMVPLPASLVSMPDSNGWPAAIAFSFVLLAIAIALIVLEFVGRRGAARIGGALIALLVILRMVDADVSLLVKGLAFIVIGTGFLVFNGYVGRHRLAAAGGTPV